MTRDLTELLALEKAYAVHVERENKRGPREPHPYVYASRRQKCLRRMVYEAAHPEYFPEFETDVKARLAAGKRREIDITTDLQRIGDLCIPKFEFVGQQERVRIYDRKKRLIISGMIDGYVKWESGAIWPTEIKHFSTYTTDSVVEFANLFHGKWTWPAAHQILSYLYAKDAPVGLFILGRMGLPRLLPVRLEEWLGDMESFIQDATICVDHIEADTLPEYAEDPEECRRCPVFGSHCNPPISYDPAAIITDEEMLAQIEHHESIKPTKVDYDQTHDDLADYLKRMTPKEHTVKNKKQIVAGKFLIETSWGKNTTTEFPDDATKALYQKTDETGKFNFKIVRVVE